MSSVAQLPLNLDMELIDASSKLPTGWIKYGTQDKAIYKTDSLYKQQGGYSVSIENYNVIEDKYTSVGYFLKAAHSGQKFTLKGFIKTEDVKNGQAGLFISLYANKIFRHKWFSGADMEGIEGTTDWQLFTLDIDYDEADADSIKIGIYLSGTGKVWLDNVSLQFDGKDISTAPLKLIKNYPETIDTVFRHSSGIGAIVLNKQQLQNLTNLGMLWGFLKYHHASIAKGHYNWDAELFRVLPPLLLAKNRSEANKVLEDWVDKVGKPEKCIKCSEIKKDAKIKLMPDYGNLFTVGNLTSSLMNKLNFILENRNSGLHFYIDKGWAGNPDFRNEEPYSEMVFPDPGYRLLALFRYWNSIQYFYPNRHLIGEDWNKVLTKYIPAFVNAGDSIAYARSCAELVANIHDSHSSAVSRVLGRTFGKYQVPVRVALSNDEIVVTGYYNADSILREKIKPGDILKKIDGNPILQILNKYLPIIGASNYATAVRSANAYLLRSDSLKTTWVLVRDGRLLTINLEGLAQDKINRLIGRDPYPRDSSFKILDGNIGYLYPGKYKNTQLDKIKETFKDTRGIIVDLRCYPSNFMPFTFVPWLKPDSSFFVKFSSGSVATPGLFTFTPELKNGLPNKDYYKSKVVIIVNEITQSQAEYTTMALQSAPNVTVIGSTTAGADGDISPLYFPGNIMSYISGLGVYYPDGTETQRVGVRIDVPIKPTIKGIKEGRDELLERAIEIIQSGR